MQPKKIKIMKKTYYQFVEKYETLDINAKILKIQYFSLFNY